MRRAGAGAAVLAGMLAGCGSTVAGVAVKAPEGADGVNVALLDTGNYATHAGHPFGTAGDPESGALLDAQRMAAFVIGPWQVDAALLTPTRGTRVIFKANGLKNSIGPDALDVAAAHGFIEGFSSTRRQPGPKAEKSLSNLIMRFPDPDSAAMAAKEMATKALPGDFPRRSASLPRHPEAVASIYDFPDISHCDACGGFAMDAYTAHGPYVLWQYATTKQGPEVAGELIAMTLDLQAPRIDEFVPTDVTKLPDLPIDPTGQLLARTLPPRGRNAPPEGGVWQPLAWLHFDGDPIKTREEFTAAGVEAVATRGATVVYQAKNDNRAARLGDQTARDVGAGARGKSTTAPLGLPTATCIDGGPRAPITTFRFACVARANRYVFAAESEQEKDAKQQISAQYRILAGK
jgi:hypothetical protein